MMTENKRFVNKGKDIFQYGEWWCSANGEHCADVIATAINELIEENEQLKSENQELKSNVIDLIDRKINKLKNINEVSIIPRESVEILKELKKELGMND